MTVFSSLQHFRLPFTWAGLVCILLASVLPPSISGRALSVWDGENLAFNAFAPAPSDLSFTDLVTEEIRPSMKRVSWSEMPPIPDCPLENEGTPPQANSLLEEEVLEELVDCTAWPDVVQWVFSSPKPVIVQVALNYPPSLRANSEPPECETLLQGRFVC